MLKTLHKPGVFKAKHTKYDEQNLCKLGKAAEGKFKALHKPGVCKAKHTKYDKQNVCKLGKGAEG